MEPYLVDKTLDPLEPLIKGEYEDCRFNGFNFSEYDLSEYKFIACTFNACNFSLTKLNKTVFRDAIFKDCKMLGLRFDSCNSFGLSFHFENCQLNHSSFYKTKIKKTVFKNCQLQETDFAEADLTSAVFDNCDLNAAIFDQTILEKADFRSAFHYSIDPELNKIKQAKFSLAGISGLLNKYDLELEN